MVWSHPVLLQRTVTPTAALRMRQLSVCVACRWRLWLVRCMDDLKKRRAYDAPSFVRDAIEFTHEWIAADNLHTFSSEPRGNPWVLSEKLLRKYKEEAWVLEMNI